MESLCGCKIPDGHPLFVLYKENDAIGKRVAVLRDQILFEEEVERIEDGLTELQKADAHFRKKAETLYPLVADRAEFAETVSAMRDEDVSILRELSSLAEDEELELDAWESRLQTVLERMRGMIGRENNVLFPLLSQTLTEEEWIQVYFKFKMIEPCFMADYVPWPRAEHPEAPRCACEL